MSKEKFTKGIWRVETRDKKLYPFITNGQIKIADIGSPKAMQSGENMANARLISQSPQLYNNLNVSTMFLQQLVKGEWSPEEIKAKAEALVYTNNILLKLANS